MQANHSAHVLGLNENSSCKTLSRSSACPVDCCVDSLLHAISFVSSWAASLATAALSRLSGAPPHTSLSSLSPAAFTLQVSCLGLWSTFDFCIGFSMRGHAISSLPLVDQPVSFSHVCLGVYVKT